MEIVLFHGNAFHKIANGVVQLQSMTHHTTSAQNKQIELNI